VPASDEPSNTGGSVWCVVVAAGSGRRFGGAKQYELLAGRRVVDRSVAVAASVCDGVVVVLPVEATGHDADVPEADVVVAGGATRADSVRAGLEAVPDDAAVVLVHDAARPLATIELFRRVVDGVRAGAAAVVPAVPVSDTIREVDGRVLDRDRLRAVQTPQGFDAAVLRAAHAAGDDATDDASLAERAGQEVVLVEGETTNLKLTARHDVAAAAAILAERRPTGGDSDA
jgi:2-C-methyl-D-erythritol 4-phosphate cytidylyltransferase